MMFTKARTFEKVSQEYSPIAERRTSVESDRDFYGKAIQKIPVWALKPNQYTHKIIRAFFEAEESTGEATIDTMEHLCSKKERSGGRHRKIDMKNLILNISEQRGNRH